MMQQSEAAYQRTDVPTTMQQSAAAYQRIDVPTTMQQSAAAYQRTDVPTTMQQSAAAYQRTDVPTTMQPEAQVPAPSAATEPPLDDKTLCDVAMRLGSDWVILAVELGSTMVEVHNIEKNYAKSVDRQGLDMLVTWKLAQSTSDEQQRTTLRTALMNIRRPDVAKLLHDTPQRTGFIGDIDAASGSPNPIIVGLSAVNINYNFPLEGPGVPAPRPQHSQKPDQEPRLGAPSYQDIGNKTRDMLKMLYKTSGSYVQLSPNVDNDQMYISGIYTKVQLETREGVAVTGQKAETVNSTEYAKIFRLRTRTGELIKRLIFYGMGGVGKSTIFDKIAYDWADETSEILKIFKLVFLLKMCALSQESDLVDSTFDQLLDEDSGIAKDGLDEFILANPSEVLILLDGFDEMMNKTLDAASFGSILKALNRTKYRECVICVSTRPSHLETLTSKSLVQNPCTHVEVLGFSNEDVNEYVQKFYDQDPDSGHTLIHTIRQSNTLHDFAQSPMLLLLMCLLWRESKQLPETTSRLFTEAVEHMFTIKGYSYEDASKAVIAIGKTALRGSIGANQTFSFQVGEFEPNALDLALRAGILTKQRVIKNWKSHRNIQFMHKTMQEYCAAKYLQSLTIPTLRFLTRLKNSITFQSKLRRMCSKLQDVVSNDFLFRFCCGDNERCMTKIVNLLNRKFNKDEPRYQSDVVQVISRNCFFESQSSKAPRCLTRDSQIPSTIEVRNNNDFRSLMYLLEIICRSESLMTQLVRLETIKVSSVSSVIDLAPALVYMQNIRKLEVIECPLGKGDFETILSSLKCNQHLTTLDMCHCNTLGGRAKEWAPHIKHLTSLNKLEISHCKLQATDIEPIALAVHDMPELTCLHLNRNEALGVSANLWAKELPKMKHLNTLNLSYCNLKPSDIEHIAFAACNMPRLTDLHLDGNWELGRLDELQSRFPLLKGHMN